MHPVGVALPLMVTCVLWEFRTALAALARATMEPMNCAA
jgi:hypothetical protein